MSDFGSYITTITSQVLVVLTLDGSAAEVGFLNASLWLPYLLFGLVVGALARGSFTPEHKDQASPTFKKTFGFHPLGCIATTPKSSWLPCCEPGEPGRTLRPTTSRSSVTRSRRSPPRTARSSGPLRRRRGIP